ncbi:hypothetical protein B0H14DRAFT_3707368, partial [Mycena olivaceomarginata]
GPQHTGHSLLATRLYLLHSCCLAKCYRAFRCTQMPHRRPRLGHPLLGHPLPHHQLCIHHRRPRPDGTDQRPAPTHAQPPHSLSNA